MIGAVERQGLTLDSARDLLQAREGQDRAGPRQGKKLYDKRADEKRRDDERDMQRAVTDAMIAPLPCLAGCRRTASRANPDFVVVRDGAAPHRSRYDQRGGEREGGRPDMRR